MPRIANGRSYGRPGVIVMRLAMIGLVLRKSQAEVPIRVKYHEAGSGSVFHVDI
jgi:hypothetical protein